MLQVLVTDQFEIVVKNGILASFWTFVLLKNSGTFPSVTNQMYNLFTASFVPKI